MWDRRVPIVKLKNEMSKFKSTVNVETTDNADKCQKRTFITIKINKRYKV